MIQFGGNSYLQFFYNFGGKMKNLKEKVLGRLANVLDKINFGETGKVGIYFGPITIQFIRLGLFVIFTISLWLIMMFLDTTLIDSGLPTYLHLAFSVVFGYLYFVKDGETAVVDAAHVAFLTFFGKRYKIYLVEGEYNWLGRRFYFDIYNKALPHAKSIGTPGALKGQVPFRSLPIIIYDNPPKNGVGIADITSNAKNDVTVTGKLTITIEVVDPMKFANSEDAYMEIGSLARTAFRSMVLPFTDANLLHLKSALQALLLGKILITAFNVKGHREESKSDKTALRVYSEGEMVLDTKGVPYYLVTELSNDEIEKINLGNSDSDRNRIKSEIIEGKKEQFAGDIIKHITNLQRKLITDDENEINTDINKLNVVHAELSPETSLALTIRNVGVQLNNAMVTDIHYSADIAAAKKDIAVEAQQAISQPMSARTKEVVSEILQKAGLDKKTAALAALMDDDVNGITIIHQPDASDDNNGTGKKISELRKSAAVIADGFKNKS